MIKKILFLSLIATSFNLYSQVTTGLVSYFPFSGNSNDNIGSDNLISVGSPLLTEDRFSNPDCAYEFPGDTNNFFQILNPSFDVNYTTGWAISLWYKGGSNDIGDYESIFRQGEKDDGMLPWDEIICSEIALYDLNTPFTTVFQDFPNTNGHYNVWAEQNANNLDSTIWHHVVLSVNPSLGSINMYVDNVLQQESIDTAQVFDVCNNSIYVGRGFQGKVDDIFYYHKFLNAIDVDELYNLPSSCSGIPLSTTKEIQIDNIVLMPNPSLNGFVHIKDYENVSSYIIYNYLGEVILTSNNLLNNQIDLTSFPSGAYFGNFYKLNGEKVSKTIIKN